MGMVVILRKDSKGDSFANFFVKTLRGWAEREMSLI